MMIVEEAAKKRMTRRKQTQKRKVRSKQFSGVDYFVL